MRLVDDATLEAVYQRDVRHALFKNTRSSSQPRLVIVGGQPRAGKTRNILRARRELAAAGDGVAFINGDELRNYHPLYDQLVLADAATAADKTGADVGWWVEKGIREAADSRFHTVIETTMRQPAVVARTVNTFAARGGLLQTGSGDLRRPRAGLDDGERAVANHRRRSVAAWQRLFEHPDVRGDAVRWRCRTLPAHHAGTTPAWSSMTKRRAL